MQPSVPSSVNIFPMKLSSLVLSSFLLLAACGGSVEQPQTTSSAASKAPVAANGHGAVKIVGEALGDVALRPEQRAEIEKLAAEAETRHAPLADGKKQLMLAFADQVERGAIDRAALQASIDKLMADVEKSRNDDRAAIAKLHGLLDRQQRNDFVDALEKSFKGKHGFGENGPPGKAFGHMHGLAEELKLTDEQKDKIKDVFKDSWHDARHDARKNGKHGGGHGHREGKHALEAFREDKLDLDKVAPPMDLKAIANEGVDRVSKIASQILPILTPEQRKVAADKLREMANNGDSSLLVH
jgi:Spy/CpxP family protein refolding chaperone